MPEDWEGHPLRKDYPVQVRKDAQTFMPLQVTEEEFKASLERDRQVRPKAVEWRRACRDVHRESTSAAGGGGARADGREREWRRSSRRARR